jgi:hypothetical protein
MLGQNPLGRWVEVPRGGSDFRHPWLVTVSGVEARVGRGLIMGNVTVEPTIGGVPIGGGDGQPPVLRLREGETDAGGNSWVCVEVTPDKDGKLDAARKESQVVVVQRAHPIADTGRTGRAPLAMLTLTKGRWQVWQVAMFHFRYITTAAADAKVVRRHFFL